MSLDRKQKVEILRKLRVSSPGLRAMPNGLLLGDHLSHVLRGIYIDGSSIKGYFRIAKICRPLYEPIRFRHFGWSPFATHAKGEYWNGDDPDLLERIKMLIREDVQPELAPLATLANLEAFQRSRIASGLEGGHAELKLALTKLAQGRVHCAMQIWDQVSAKISENALVAHPGVGIIVSLLQKSFRLWEQRQVEKIAALLRAVEKESAEVWGVAKFWEPQSFPGLEASI